MNRMIAVIVMVVVSGCGMSSIELAGFEDVECRPRTNGEGSICRATMHFDVDDAAPEDDYVFGSIDSPWGSASFSLDVKDGADSWAIDFGNPGACDEGRVSLYGYVELVENEDTADWDSATRNVDVECTY